MNRLAFALLFLLLLLPLAADGAQRYLAHGGTIHTADPDQPRVEALVWSDEGTILARGELERLRDDFPDARDIDLAGAVLIPGLVDAHAHLLGLGQSLMRVDLVGTGSPEEVLQRTRAFAETLPRESWLLGRGWDQNDWGNKSFPDRALLDRHFPDRPVFLTRVDGHAGWANSAAMAATDRRFEGDWQPEGGLIVRDAQGRATGVFIDAAMGLIRSAIPEPTASETREAIERALEKAASVGLTAVHEAGTPLSVLRIYQALAAEGRLSLRIYAMADGEGAALEHLCQEGPVLDESGRVDMRAVKFYADGALGSRGAALLADYSDDPGNRGLLIQSPEKLKQLADRAMGCGLQVNVHAIGDRGNRVVLDALAYAMERNPGHVGRHRVEHAQVLAPAEFDRMKKLDLIASMQPTHATSDMPWAEDRLGPERILGAYAWQRLLELGVPLALGSDFPVERPDPLLGFYAAIGRRDLAGHPEGGWYPDQALTRDQALAGFTRWAAHAAFDEEQIGMLRAGMRADLVLLSGDILALPLEELPKLRVLATLVDGSVVYREAAAPPGLK